MSKKKLKKEKKQKPGMIVSPWTDKTMHHLMHQFEAPTMHVRLEDGGKVYEGNIPCMGEVEP